MVEPIQGEGGVNLPPAGYLEGLRELCDRYKLLLIFDEVQTGMGRTGKWYTHQHWNVKPDIITLAKAVAGGVALGGMLARPDVAEKLKPGTHAATFGGNPIACRAALATIETIEADGLLDRADHIGETFRTRFEALKAKVPARPRGAGEGGDDRRPARHRRGPGRRRVPEAAAARQLHARDCDSPAAGPEHHRRADATRAVDPGRSPRYR